MRSRRPPPDSCSRAPSRCCRASACCSRSWSPLSPPPTGGPPSCSSSCCRSRRAGSWASRSCSPSSASWPATASARPACAPSAGGCSASWSGPGAGAACASSKVKATAPARVPGSTEPVRESYALTGILVIGGMHRSGTSLMAALACEAGFDMGTRLLLAGLGNPGGHFEDLDFLSFHDAALAARGAGALAVPPDFSFAPTATEEEAARALLRERLAKPRWGFKDPRATLFLDFWADRLPEARFLLLYRHPVEVILSLLRRGMDLETMAHPASALRSWEVHNERALAFRLARPERCELWELRALAKDPAAACERLAAVTGHPLRAGGAGVFRAPDLHLGLAAPEIGWDEVIPGAMALHRRLGEAASWRGEDAPRAASAGTLEAAAEHLLATALRRE